MSVRHSILNFSGFFSITSLHNTAQERRHLRERVTRKLLVAAHTVAASWCLTCERQRKGCWGWAALGPWGAWSPARWPSAGSLSSCQPCRWPSLSSTGTCIHSCCRKTQRLCHSPTFNFEERNCTHLFCSWQAIFADCTYWLTLW